MKKTYILGTLFTSLLFSGSLAHAGSNFYMAANAGLALLNDADITDSTVPFIHLSTESEAGMAFALATGYTFGNVRVEGEVTYQKNDLDSLSLSVIGVDLGSASISGDTSSTAFLINGYYDFKNTTSFTPFIGGGLGMANVDLGAITLDNYGPLTTSIDDNVFAYQLTFGVNYAFNSTVSLDLKYRYFATEDLEVGSTKIEYSSHNIYAGVKIDF